MENILYFKVSAHYSVHTYVTRYPLVKNLFLLCVLTVPQGSSVSWKKFMSNTDCMALYNIIYLVIDDVILLCY